MYVAFPGRMQTHAAQQLHSTLLGSDEIDGSLVRTAIVIIQILARLKPAASVATCVFDRPELATFASSLGAFLAQCRDDLEDMFCHSKPFEKYSIEW